ncbi:MAG: PH domain-containing protein [Planctomycetota bacterium]
MTENEETLRHASPSMFRNHPIWFAVCCLLCLVIVGIPMLLIWFLEVKATRVTVTNKRTTLHKGLLSRSITEVWHRDVRNVQLSQSFLQRILGVGRIAISSAGQSGIEIDVSGLSNPDEIKSIIDRHRTT